MGFWKWLFGRKKQEEAQEEWEETVYERGKVNFNEAEERTKEMQLLNGEYAIVTSYLTDMEEIEALPPEHMAEIKGCAGKMQTLEADRRRYLDKERHLSEAEYRQMRSQENEIEEGIAKLQEAERYRKLVRQDLARLDGERHAYGYRKQELRTGLVNLKGMAVICLTALLACIFMLLILQFGFHMNTAVGYYVSAGAAAIAITVLFVKYADTEKELARVETAANKLIHLQNKVKIRYVNNTNLLEYLYLKYGVESAVKLKEQWDMYQEEKEERRQYAEAEAKLEYYRKQLIRLLIQFRVKDPERWVMQPGAIIDARERLEIRHDLVARRQALRKQLAYNQQLAEAAQQEIKDVAAEYPHYAAEIAEMVEKYEEKYG